MAFSELIKNFSKTRDYMRDFYIYGFKVRGDFDAKSARTYDNEKRRIESWLGEYVRWENDKRGKRVSISLDSTAIRHNPLYNAWKAKSFTDNDITLHFAVLAALREGPMSVAELTDAVCTATGRTFDVQTVRNKAKEYVQEGLLCKIKRGKSDYYSLSPITLKALPAGRGHLLDAITFFQETAPFGFVGSTILDVAGAQNEMFRFKHHYMVHTLEDMVLFDLLCARHEKKRVTVILQSARNAGEIRQTGVPLQIFVSVQSGRRYVCMYTERNRRFHNYRLDYIKSVKSGDHCPEFDDLIAKLDRAKPFCWGVSFGRGSERGETLNMTLYIDEQQEGYILRRLAREGRGGTVTRLKENTFQYSITLFDISEMMAWVKSFTGRIIALESNNQAAVDLFRRDMTRMAKMYGGEN